MAPTNVRVVVRLPFNRADHPIDDPPQIEWNAEKADILWKVIARSRASDSGGTDWKGLAAHLEVPLPYLLYRAQTRYEEDLRGLQDIRGALSPTSAQFAPKSPHEGNDRPGAMAARMASSSRLVTPLGVRARLGSLGANGPRLKKTLSSSTTTLQGPRKANPVLGRTSPSSSEEGTDSEDEEVAKEEEADRKLEEQEALDKKLKNLQTMMTNDRLGLVSSPSTRLKPKGVDRGRLGLTSPQAIQESLSHDELSSRSTSQSVSSTSSRQGSIQSIPSPPAGQGHSPIGRHLSSSKSSSPPAVSPRSAHGQHHLTYGPMVGRAVSEQGSSRDSETSDFSDLSEASLSASALESALLSNIRGGGSRLSAFARSRFGGRTGGGGGVRL